MSRVLAIACGVLALLLAIAIVVGFCFYCDRNDERTLKEQAEANVAMLITVNAGQAKTIEYQQQARAIDNRLIAQNASQHSNLATTNRSLEAQLQEALKDAEKKEPSICPSTSKPKLSLDALLPFGATDALCLRWQAASGRTISTGHNQGDPAGSIYARASDTSATDCSRWRGLTVRGVIEYVGDLIDHAGADRLDKAGIRAWAIHTEVIDMGKGQ